MAVSFKGVCFSFLKSFHTLLHSGANQFTPPTTVEESSVFSTLSPELVICRHCDDGHSDQCEMIPRACFNLCLSNSYQC